MVGKKSNDSSIAVTPDVVDAAERDNFLFILNDAINYLHNKAVNGKVRNAQNERVKIDYFRALIYAISTANGVYKDKQLDNLEKDVAILKNMYLSNSGETTDNGNLSPTAKAELDEIDAKIEKVKEKIN